MKVLHVLDHSIPLQSGYTFRTRSILQEQRKLGWETSHLTSAKHAEAVDECPQHEVVDGLEFYRTGIASGALTKVPMANQLAVVDATAKRLEEAVAEVQPDVLHAHSPALNGLAALRVGRRHGIPVVYEVRAFWEDAAVDHGTAKEWGLRYRLTRALESHVLRNANAVTTICEGLRKDIIERGINAQKITVIPNAVDAERFTFGGETDLALAQALGLQQSTVLGFIGSFYGYEGLPLLVEALPLIQRAQPEVKLLLVGGGPDESAVRAKIAELRLQQSVILTGRVPHSEVERYYNLVDLLIYPRLPMRLTELVTPLKPLEAMARGRPVIASDVGGHKELITDRENGLLFTSGSAQALADTVAELSADPALRTTLAEQGRRYVETERTWARSVARYQDVYESLVPRLAAA